MSVPIQYACLRPVVVSCHLVVFTSRWDLFVFRATDRLSLEVCAAWSIKDWSARMSLLHLFCRNNSTVAFNLSISEYSFGLKRKIRLRKLFHDSRQCGFMIQDCCSTFIVSPELSTLPLKWKNLLMIPSHTLGTWLNNSVLSSCGYTLHTFFLFRPQLLWLIILDQIVMWDLMWGA